ncbi:bifunctional DNA primase/polymerase [Nodosilinea sp. LEGE 07298]|uniref:bifunctional DNA primase/polymerase n=1 Tax=Nodosilinea sp. LEGE 07298 TaxID=2777970 RepID=UPI001D14AE72|nr:bifunctional DNA primase/polymerase [Nodosilinea sp. LEGE 07298]
MALPHNAGVWATVQWLAARKLPALPVAPAQDPYRYPRIVAAKPQRGIYEHVECYWQDGQLRPNPLFTGKNPSYLDGRGIPHLVYHHHYQNRLPTQQELRQWFAHPQTGVGSLGGHQGLAWIDFDTKGFESSKACDQAIAQWLNQHPRLKDTFAERTHSGGWRFAVKLQTSPGFTNFALEPGGEHVGEVLGTGRFTVLAPTIGPSGNPYLSVQRAEPVEIGDLFEIGLFSSSSRQAEQRPAHYQPKPPLPPLQTNSGQGAIHLADLVTTKVRDILTGQDLYQDESMSLVAAARELYGSENWAFANRVPLVGDLAEALIHRVGDAFGYDDDKLRRCLALVNPETCHPASVYRGDETALWKRVRRLDRGVFESCCPTSTQTEITRKIEAYGRLPTPSSNPSNLQKPTLIQLREWYRIARVMEAPESTLEAIQTIGQRVAEGKPMPRKDREFMQQQLQSYWQQVNTVIHQAGQILEKVGQNSPAGTTFEGRTYRIEKIDEGILQVSAQQRGIILAVGESCIQCCHLKRVDFEQFTCFSQHLSLSVSRVPQLELV